MSCLKLPMLEKFQSQMFHESSPALNPNKSFAKPRNKLPFVWSVPIFQTPPLALERLPEGADWKVIYDQNGFITCLMPLYDSGFPIHSFGGKTIPFSQASSASSVWPCSCEGLRLLPVGWWTREWCPNSHSCPPLHTCITPSSMHKQSGAVEPCYSEAREIAIQRYAHCTFNSKVSPWSGSGINGEWRRMGLLCVSLNIPQKLLTSCYRMETTYKHTGEHAYKHIHPFPSFSVTREKLEKPHSPIYISNELFSQCFPFFFCSDGGQPRPTTVSVSVSSSSSTAASCWVMVQPPLMYLQELYGNRYRAMMMECVLGARYLPRLAAAFGIVCLASAFFQFSFHPPGLNGWDGPACLR